MGWEDSMAQKMSPNLNREDLAFMRMKFQAQRPQILVHLRLNPVEPYFIVIQHNKIIHVADVVPTPQILLHKVIKTVEIKIAEKLTRQVANRDAAPTIERGK